MWVVLAGLPEQLEALPAVASSRVFGPAYPLNLTRLGGDRPLWLLHGFVDGSAANVYQVGRARAVLALEHDRKNTACCGRYGRWLLRARPRSTARVLAAR